MKMSGIESICVNTVCICMDVTLKYRLSSVLSHDEVKQVYQQKEITVL